VNHHEYLDFDSVVVKCLESCAIEESDRLYAPSDLVRVEQSKAVACRNTVRVNFYSAPKGGKRHVETGLFVFVLGRIALGNRHTIPQDAVSIRVFNPWQPTQGSEIPISECKISYLKNTAGQTIDLALIEFPSFIPSRPNIVNKFVSASDVPLIAGGELVLDSLRMIKDVPTLCSLSTDSFKIYTQEIVIENHRCVPEPLVYNGTFQYRLDTQAGDSGAILSARCPLVPGKLVGIHAGGPSGNKFGIPFTKEFLLRSLREHYDSQKTPISNRLDSTAPFSAESAAFDELSTSTIDDALGLLEMTSVKLPRQGSAIHMGTAPMPNQPTKSKVCPSAVSGVFGPPSSRPAHLKPFDLNGTQIEPHSYSSRKLLHDRPFIPSDRVKRACKAVSNHLGLAPKDSYYRRVFTIEEAVSALGIEELSSIKRGTSKGYPSNLKGTCSTKRELLGKEGDFVIDPELRRAVNEMIEVCKQGKRPSAIWQATLKDERRPHAKVDAGETRQIYAGWIVLLIVCRMYFGGALAWTVKNRIDNSCAIGVNPYSVEWQQIADHLHQKGRGIVSGDHKNYDGENNACVTNGILQIMEDHYADDSQENTTIRAALWDTMVAADVLIAGEVIRLTHSQPSGNFLTTWINCISNLVYHVMVFDILCEKHGKVGLNFFDHISIITYGDDVMFAPDTCCQSMYNFPNVRDVFNLVFGMVYTLENKSVDDIGYRPIEEVEFLKRGFVKNDCCVYVAPLNIKSIYEMVNWIRGRRTKEATAVNVEFAVRELYYHGRDVYERDAEKLRRACAEAGVTASFPAYETWDYIWKYENGLSPVTSSDFSNVAKFFEMRLESESSEEEMDCLSEEAEWDQAICDVKNELQEAYLDIIFNIPSREAHAVALDKYHYTLTFLNQVTSQNYYMLYKLRSQCMKHFAQFRPTAPVPSAENLESDGFDEPFGMIAPYEPHSIDECVCTLGPCPCSMCMWCNRNASCGRMFGAVAVDIPSESESDSESDDENESGSESGYDSDEDEEDNLSLPSRNIPLHLILIFYMLEFVVFNVIGNFCRINVPNARVIFEGLRFLHSAYYGSDNHSLDYDVICLAMAWALCF
jgi:hypothetical protein